MTLPRTVAEVLSEHVVFEVECIDRMYLNVYVPQLQHAGGVVGYVHRQLGLPVASTAPLAKITDRFTAAVHRFAEHGRIPWVDFAKGQRKDESCTSTWPRSRRPGTPRVCCSSAGRRRRPRCSGPRNAANATAGPTRGS